jgi:hypothetical protein
MLGSLGSSAAESTMSRRRISAWRAARVAKPFALALRRSASRDNRRNVDTLVRPMLRRFALQPLWPRNERMVLRTILVPHRSAPMRVLPAAG